MIRIFCFRRGEEFEVTPTSSELLFYPPSRVVTVSGKSGTLVFMGKYCLVRVGEAL